MNQEMENPTTGPATATIPPTKGRQFNVAPSPGSRQRLAEEAAKRGVSPNKAANEIFEHGIRMLGQQPGSPDPAQGETIRRLQERIAAITADADNALALLKQTTQKTDAQAEAIKRLEAELAQTKATLASTLAQNKTHAQALESERRDHADQLRQANASLSDLATQADTLTAQLDKAIGRIVKQGFSTEREVRKQLGL